MHIPVGDVLDSMRRVVGTSRYLLPSSNSCLGATLMIFLAAVDSLHIVVMTKPLHVFAYKAASR